MGIDITPREALELFPYPSFRKYQKKVIEKVAEAFQSGYDTILIEAPTGFGKSAVNTVFCRAVRSFYSTPQLTLIDQIKSDPYIGKYYAVIKGRQNYRCPFNGLPVNIGKCVLEMFQCDKLNDCPYWIAKARAARAKSVLTSFAYLVLEGTVDDKSPVRLGHRKLLVLDESHSMDRALVNHISVTISPRTLGPDIYRTVRSMIKDNMNGYTMDKIVETVLDAIDVYVNQKVTNLIGEQISIEDAKMLDKLDRFRRTAEMYLQHPDAEWVYEVGWETDRNFGKYKYVSAKPVYAKDFTEELVWSRADNYILSSATILEPNIFLREVGIDPTYHGVYVIRVPSTFPPENRPIIDATIGKMTKDQRDDNIRAAVEKINKILDIEKGNVAIHAHSYELAKSVFEMIDKRHQSRLIVHNSTNRNVAVEIWKKSRGKVFIGVRFEEGQDWKGGMCDAQILLKVQYPDINDPRVKVRLDRKQWLWYRLEALKMVIQSYGRAVRSETDKERFYIIDESFVNLISWAWNWIPKWFKDALPPHWNKDKIKDKIAELKRIRRETGRYRGWSDSKLKQEAVRLLREEAIRKGLVV